MPLPPDDTDPNPFLTAMKGMVKPLGRDDNCVSRVAKKTLVIDLPRRARTSDKVGRDRAVNDVGGREMDGKMAARVRAGKIHIEARLDLHGDTVDQARARVQAFVQGAVDRGYRCILVITGKGTFGNQDISKHIDAPHRGGRIRAAFPGWVNEPPLDRLVLTTAPAQQKDGGMGAFYVYLRQEKKR